MIIPVYTGRAWSVTLPPNTVLLTSNDRLSRHAEAKRIADLRELGGWMARKARIPPISCAHILGYLLVTDPGRRRDPMNWYPTAKAVLDGVVDAKVLPDDDKTHVLGPHLFVHDGTQHQFVMRIRELTAMPQDPGPGA